MVLLLEAGYCSQHSDQLWTVRVSNPSRGRRFYLLQTVKTGPGHHSAPYSMGTGALYRG